jgi:hypothetical protein
LKRFNRPNSGRGKMGDFVYPRHGCIQARSRQRLTE